MSGSKKMEQFAFERIKERPRLRSKSANGSSKVEGTILAIISDA